MIELEWHIEGGYARMVARAYLPVGMPLSELLDFLLDLPPDGFLTEDYGSYFVEYKREATPEEMAFFAVEKKKRDLRDDMRRLETTQKTVARLTENIETLTAELNQPTKE